MNDYKVLDLFSGAGGFSCGLEMIDSFKTVIANDFNELALKSLQHNNPNVKCILGDITNQKVKNKIIEESKKQNVNMIIGGPPCQGFSNKGKKMGLLDERNYLFLEYIDMVEKIKPEIFIIENVKNLITCANGYFINEIVNKFQKIGYFVKYKILNSYDFGVPQNRERAIIIGTRKFDFNFHDLLSEEYEKNTVKSAISDLAYLNSGEGKNHSNYLLEPQSLYQKEIRNKNNNLFNHKATNHTKIALKKLSFIPPEGDKKHLPIEMWGKQKFKTTWSRLEWNKPSPTIDTRFDTPSNGRNSHPFLNRAITPREAARIQSFPDSYEFIGPKTEICKQIGNAVPPLMAKAIAKSLKRQTSYFNQYKNNEKYKLFNANSNYFFNYLKENNIKFDHIITDPPYLISKQNNLSTLNNSKRKGVDFGVWDKNFNLTDWISKYVKFLNTNGSIIIFCSYKYISYIISELENLNFIVKDFLEWKKKNPMPRNVNRRYVQDTEFAIWAVRKKSKWIFNKPDNVPYLRSAFETSIVNGKERTKHPTQKSLNLMENIIKIHTNENEIIFDPFMGSGTTGIAALNNSRKFIGVEISEEYYKISLKRLDEANRKIKTKENDKMIQIKKSKQTNYKPA